jgi:hypothetical protein
MHVRADLAGTTGLDVNETLDEPGDHVNSAPESRSNRAHWPARQSHADDTTCLARGTFRGQGHSRADHTNTFSWPMLATSFVYMLPETDNATGLDLRQGPRLADIFST